MFRLTGVIWHFVLSFSDLLDNWKCWNLTLKLTAIISSVCVVDDLEVDRISASVSAPNVDKWALSTDIRFRPKAVIQHSVHFRFRRAAVGKFGDCRK